MNDVIIVGGGLAGLAAAAFCARAGLRVTVLERAKNLGGRARTDLVSGHAFNQGGHALYAKGAAARVLGELGVGYTGAPPPASGLLAVVRGGVHRLPSGMVSILATDLFGFGAKVEAARAFTALARADRRQLRDVSWRSWVDGVAARPDVRAVLDAFARLTTYANCPERASAGETIGQIRRGVDGGVLYLDGGWQTLVDGLQSAAERAGATIVSSAAVTSVRRDGSSFVVSVSGGDAFASRTAIVCTGPSTARSLLGDASIGGLLAMHAACLDVGLSGLPRPDRLFALGIDRPTYCSVHSATARLAERGATIHLMKYLAPDAPADPHGDERELEALLDLVQPGWRARVTARRFLPNLVSTSALVEARTRRPEVDATGAVGVFIAGDWVGSEGMLVDAALASARTAAQRAIECVAVAGADGVQPQRGIATRPVASDGSRAASDVPSGRP